jgi:predicted peptidase
MNAGKLNTRVEVKRLTKTPDGFGGTTSTTATVETLWANKKDMKGDISDTEGKRGRSVMIELELRKKAADLIQDNDILKIENKSGNYRINGIYDSDQDFFTVIKATKLD